MLRISIQRRSIVIHADGRTDMRELMVRLSDFAKRASKVWGWGEMQLWPNTRKNWLSCLYCFVRLTHTISEVRLLISLYSTAIQDSRQFGLFPADQLQDKS